MLIQLIVVKALLNIFITSSWDWGGVATKPLSFYQEMNLTRDRLMAAEHITIVDNRAKYRARLANQLKIDPSNVSLLKKSILVRLYSV